MTDTAGLPLYDLDGKELKRIKVDERLAGHPVKRSFLSQIVLMTQSNQRQGTHATKTRGEVSGGGRKPWRQKGTGRARVGSIRNPLWRHGGTVFGPHPREYRKEIPRAWRREALLMSLGAKVRDEELLLVNPISISTPKTKQMASLFKALPVKGKTLLIVGKMTPPLERSARNIPRLLVKAGKDVSAYDVLRHKSIVLEEEAFKALLKEAS